MNLFKKFNHRKIALLTIVLGSLMRVLWLGRIPSAFFRDEAAIGYNAYSIWETGKDEFGMRFPLVFRSFEVFFLPLYVYLSAPIVGILGLTEFSTRLLSGISGVAALGLVYLIAKETWDGKVALFSTLVLAIAPWHIFYSRGTFEGNLALTLFIAGFYFWLKFIKGEKISHFFLSTLFFALSMYSYQSERVVVVLFALIAVCFSWKKIWHKRRSLVFPVLIVAALLIPLISLTFKSGGYHRAYGVSVFAGDEKPPGWVDGLESNIFTNNAVYLRGRQIASLYLSYFSPRNLFIEGDYLKQRSVDNFSVFYAWMLPFMLIGLWQLNKRRSSGKLLVAWMLVAPLPAALTSDPFHTYRSLLLYLPLTLIVGFGLATVFQLVKNQGKTLYLLGTIIVSGVSLLSFLFSYAVVNQVTRAPDWDYGYCEIVEFANSMPKNKKIVVDDLPTEAYIHFLFFGRVNPKVYQNAVLKTGDPRDYYYTDASEIRPLGFENFEFRQVDWPSERGDSGTIFVMRSEDFPESEFVTDPKVKLLKEIMYPDGTIAYRIIEIVEQ